MLTRQAFPLVYRLGVCGLFATAAAACGPAPAPAAGPQKQIVVSVRTPPQSLNWYTRRDATTYLVSLLTHARLVRINAATQQVEPWLAESWTRVGDRTYRVTLRPDLRFSDGHPMTAADVLFSVEAAFDQASTLASALTWEGQRLEAAALDSRTVELTFPQPFGPELRVLDSLPILPRHKLQAALAEGRFGAAWSTAASPGDIAGLGPFVLAEYAQGERLVFVRNPHYFRRDGQGLPLPRLDRVVVGILPDQDTQMLSLEAGETDAAVTEIRPSDYAAARRLAEAGKVQLLDLGVAMNPDGLWFNLKPGAFAADTRRGWIQRDELRQAISLGVDRQLFADTVFAGAAVPVGGPVTPANRLWSAESPPAPGFDPAAARRHLTALGLADRDADGFFDDQGTRHARFTILTQKGQTSLERGAGAIRDQLRAIGLEVDVSAIDAGALIQRFLSGSGYDAVYFNLTTTDSDPASQLDFWTSSGAAHVWNLGPAHDVLPWERDIDALMKAQATTLDAAERVRIFGRVQQLFARHQPIIYFAAPRVFVAASTRMTHLTPAVTRPQLLWAADTIDVTW